jgi:hypothetical protein
VSRIGFIGPVTPDCVAKNVAGLAFHDFDDLVEQATKRLSERGLTELLGDAAVQRAPRYHTHDLCVAAILEKLS